MKKILAVSLESQQKYYATAVYDDGRLMITHAKAIKGSPDVWTPQLLKELQEKNEAGFACLVEDRTMNFSSFATSFSFDALEDDGRIALQHCLDWYSTMSNRGTLILDPSLEAFHMRFGKEGSMIDVKHDDKGRAFYHVDWSIVNGGHKAVLMCIAAAVMESPLSDRWINAFVGKMKNDIPAKNPLSSLEAITKGVTIANAEQIESAFIQRQAEIQRFHDANEANEAKGKVQND